MFGKKTSKKPVVRRKSFETQTQVRSYYTPSQQDRIEIDMATRRAKDRKGSLQMIFGRGQKVLVGLFVVFVLYMLVVIKGQPVVTIENSFPGSTTSKYIAKAQELFGSSLLNTNKLTLQRSRIEKELIHEYPEIESANVAYSFVGRKPEVHIILRSLPFVYEALGTRYTVSDTGKNVGRTSESPAQAGALLIKDESGVQIEKGQTIMRSSDISFLTTVVKIFSSKGRAVEYVRITSVPREIYVRLTGVSYDIKMYLEDDPRQQTGAFLAVEKILGEGGVVPSQYVDVRASEKVYWQ